MKALIIGATGATGKDLVEVLLADPAYTSVVTFVRKSSGQIHPKLTEIITNFDKLEDVANDIKGDVWFSCLGTTLKVAGSKEAQWKIDHDIPLRFAEISKKNGVPSAVLLSAYGASSKSSIFYGKMKGHLEETIENLSFDQYLIFRPGLLLRKDTDRFGEKIVGGVLTFLTKLRLVRRYRPMPTRVLAEKLAKAPKVFEKGKRIFELDEIFKI